jgi:hypothetical protein
MLSEIFAYKERLVRETQKSKIHQLPQFDEIWRDQIDQGQGSRDLLVYGEVIYSY